jgi:hypothetical protein
MIIKKKIMLRKKIAPVIEGKKVVGTVVELRVLGVLVYKKTLVSPAKYGLTEWEFIYAI